MDVKLNLTQQEFEYVVQLLIARPLAEALPLYLKVTGQRIAPQVLEDGLRAVP